MTLGDPDAAETFGDPDADDDADVRRDADRDAESPSQDAESTGQDAESTGQHAESTGQDAESTGQHAESTGQEAGGRDAPDRGRDDAAPRGVVRGPRTRRREAASRERDAGSRERDAGCEPDAANENARRRRSGARIAAVPIDERDLERGAVAAVYLGLGVLAANAAYQQYSTSGRTNGAYMPLEYDVLRSGYLSMSELAFLLAVQAVARDDDAPPAGLSPPQRDEVRAWITAIRAGEVDELESLTGSIRARLAIADGAEPRAPRAIEAFDDPGDDGEAPRSAFRWRTHRAGTGFLVGSVLGVALAVFVPVRGLAPLGAAVISVVGGFVAGRRIRVARCSRCLTLVRDGSCCPRCNATLRGDIAHLNDRLAAEEALEDEMRATRPPVRTLDALDK